jgi:hypothetical protein
VKFLIEPPDPRKRPHAAGTFIPLLFADLDGHQNFMDADSFGIYMRQRTGIHFFPLKELKTRATHTEFKVAYGPEALALPTVKKWQGHFHQENESVSPSQVREALDE